MKPLEWIKLITVSAFEIVGLLGLIAFLVKCMLYH